MQSRPTARQIHDALWKFGHMTIAQFGRDNAQIVLDVDDSIMDALMASFKGSPGNRSLEEEFAPKAIESMKRNLAKTKRASRVRRSPRAN